MQRSAGLTLAATMALTLGAAAPVLAAADQPIQLTLTTWWGGAAADTWTKELIPAFEKAHPNVKVTLRQVGWGDYYDKWVAAWAAGDTLGDVVLLDAKFAQNMFTDGDFWTDLTPLMKTDGLDESRFAPAAIRQFRPYGRTGQQLYGLPMVIGTVVPFYNADILADAGMDAPDESWTWDRFFETATKLTQSEGGKVKRSGFDGSSTWIADAIIPSQGGLLLSADHAQPAMNNPQAVAALQRLHDLKSSGAFGGSFGNATTAFHFGGDWEPAGWSGYKFKWDVMPVPKGNSGRFTTAWTNAWGIPAGESGDKLKAAWELAKFMATNPQRLGIPLTYDNMMPGYIPTALSDQYMYGSPRMNRQRIVDMEVKNEIVDIITPQFIRWHDQVWGGLVQQTVDGKTSPGNAVAQAQEQIAGQHLLQPKEK